MFDRDEASAHTFDQMHGDPCPHCGDLDCEGECQDGEDDSEYNEMMARRDRLDEYGLYISGYY